MNADLLNSDIQEFISLHTGSDVAKLALRKNLFPKADWIEILNQISSRSKARDKLPTWFAAANIIYPAKISVEQTSSEKTAQYKASLVSGKKLIDLTGGFGVDDYFFSKQFEKVIHCEINAELSAVVRHNFTQLGVTNIECISEDSLTVLKNSSSFFDWIYIDPSRRNDTKGKVFMLKDCLPNVPELLDYYLKFTNNILLKTAPILDISAGLSELKNVKRIHIIAIENEVKELLWEMIKGYLGTIEIKTANFTKNKLETFDFVSDGHADCSLTHPKKYLYEPNSAIMKSGGFDEISFRFRLDKLHRHSHLYTADRIIDFPGRTFEITGNFPYQKPQMKQWLENTNANITTRNFPDTVEAIRKKWKIKDGGSRYCFFTTDMNNNKIVLICTKIN